MPDFSSISIKPFPTKPEKITWLNKDDLTGLEDKEGWYEDDSGSQFVYLWIDKTDNNTGYIGVCESWVVRFTDTPEFKAERKARRDFVEGKTKVDPGDPTQKI